MANAKALTAAIVNEMTNGKLEELKRDYARLLSECSVREVREFSFRLPASASPSAFVLLYAMTEEYVLLNNYSSLNRYLSLLADRIGERELSRYWAEEYERYFGKEREAIDPPPAVKGGYYAYEYEGEYAVDGKKYPLRVASFSREIGKNMTALVTRYGAILFDCGSGALREGSDEMQREELLSFFEENGFTPKDVVAVFLSHAHLDHYGSSGILPQIGIPESKIFADPDTLKIARRQMDTLPYFSEQTLYHHPFVKVEPFRNGHILGSTGYVVSFDRINIVYTGDFCKHDQRTVEGVKAKDILRLGTIYRHGVHLLITETTYGRRADTLSYADRKKLFSYFDNRLKKLKIRKFFPAFAVGRSQEVLLDLKKEQKILLVGAAAGMTELYEKSLKRALYKGGVREGGREREFDSLIASSGMLAKDSASYRYAQKFENEEKATAMIVTGYMAEDGYGYEVMKDWIASGKTLLFLPLSAHADRAEILSLISELAPERVLTVHGEGLSGVKYENEEIFSRENPPRRAEGGSELSPDEIAKRNLIAFYKEVCRVNGVAEQDCLPLKRIKEK